MPQWRQSMLSSRLLVYSFALAVSTAYIHQSAVAQQVPSKTQAAKKTHANNNTTLDTVVIKNDNATDSAMTGFVPDITATGSKETVDVSKIPQSISVVGRDQMDATGAQKGDEALRYTAGVFAQPFGVDNDTNWIYVRGFDATQTGAYLDGLQNYSYGFGGFLIDSYTLDRIEVLKGPSSALYGGANPGGIINYISKRPTFSRIRATEVGVNSYGNAYLGFDIGDKIQEGVSYRVSGKIQGGSNYTDYSKEFRGVVSPTIEFKPDESTRLTILGNYTHLDLTHDGGGFLPYYGTVVPTQFGKIPRKVNYTEPNIDRYNREQTTIGYEFEHSFDNNWTARQNVRYGYAHVQEHSLYAYGYEGYLAKPSLDNPNIARINFQHDTSVNTFAADNMLEGSVTTGQITHNLLLGSEYRYFLINQMQQTGSATVIDGYNPIYGAAQGPMWDPYIDQKLTRNQLGLYAQDRMEFGDGWIVTLNGRYDHIWTKAKGLPTYEYTTGQWSGRAGLGYEFENGITPYASIATIFNPIIETLADKSYAKPETGQQYEIGVKYRPQLFDGLITASLFDLTKKNSLTGSSYTRTQLGKVNSRGFEIEMQANINENWKITSNFTTYKIKIKDDETTPALIGKRPYLIPEQQAGIFAEYRFNHGSIEGLILGGGIRYVGSTFADEENTLKVPSVTVADLKIGYKKDNWGVDLNVTNLFNKEYVAGCQGIFVCGYGEGRKALLRLHTKW